MNQTTKALLIPFVRIFQVILAIILLAISLAMVYGILIYEKQLWLWSWKVGIGLHIFITYVIAVDYCYKTRSDWWPE